MPQYADSIVTSKLGINYVRSIVESAKCIFHKIDQENDLGIDAIIELVKDGVPLNQQIAVQIKSGKSYYNANSNQCIIPVGTHFDYWLNYPVPVYGIVYIPSMNTANWVDIKTYLRNHGKRTVIKFDRTRTNIFDDDNFLKIFMPTVLNRLPKLSFEEAASLFHSSHPSEKHLGLLVLFRSAPNNLQIWDWFISYFKTRPAGEIAPILIYYFAHIPWHPDILYRGEEITPETKKYVQRYFNSFDKQDIVKLLSFIDQETMISRGSIGQSVETIISSIQNRDALLLEVIEDNTLPMFLRECAGLIYAYHNNTAAIPVLKSLSEQGSEYSDILISTLKEYGWIDLYT